MDLYFETARLVIRPLQADDLATLYPLIYADPAVAASFTTLTDYEAVSRTHQKKVQYNHQRCWTAPWPKRPSWGTPSGGNIGGRATPPKQRRRCCDMPSRKSEFRVSSSPCLPATPPQSACWSAWFVVVPNENPTLDGVVGILTRAMYQEQQREEE